MGGCKSALSWICDNLKELDGISDLLSHARVVWFRFTAWMDMVGLNEMQSVRPVAWVSFIYAEMLDLGLEIDISGSSIYTRRAIALSGHCPSHTLANRMASPSRWVKCEYSEIFLEQVSVGRQRAWVLGSGHRLELE